MWFYASDLTRKKIIKVNDLHGYVLPHAGTAFTGNIISHTLRFRPTRKITRVLILYYPSSAKPDVDQTYYHEFYVPWQSMNTIFQDKQIQYDGFNISQDLQTLPSIDQNTLIVVSADFSHFLPMQQGIELENIAGRALMFRALHSSSSIVNKALKDAVDDVKTFQALYDIIPSQWNLQWIGRDRSSGENAVGYLSFLIREQASASAKRPDGMFVTVYSQHMKARECLGEWFNNGRQWTNEIEQKLIDKVIFLGKSTSRLTNGSDVKTPLTNYTVTYLYKDKEHSFIRGWHGILHKAFYLPDVFLENTYNNGKWITSSDKTWQNTDKKNVFNLWETLTQLEVKAGLQKTFKQNGRQFTRRRRQPVTKDYTLYSSQVANYNII